MIEEFFGSKSFYATFAIFFDYPHDPLHARLIARATGCDVKCVHRQLARLVRRRYPGLKSPFEPLEIIEDLMDDGD